MPNLWYVHLVDGVRTALRTEQDWASVVSSGVAQVDVSTVLDVEGTTNDRIAVWARRGVAVSDARVTAAIATSSALPLPPPYEPPSPAPATPTSTHTWRTGITYGPVGPLGTSTPGLGEVRLVPLLVPAKTSVAEVVAHVTTAGSAGATARLVIAKDDGGRPGAVVFASAALPAATTGRLAATVDLQLAAGRHYVGVVSQGAPTTVPTYRGVGSSEEMYEQPEDPGTYMRAAYSWYGVTAAVAGAVPAVLGLDAGDAPRVVLKVA